MKIGVMSDTHGHLDAMRRVASEMLDAHGVDVIIHLGDDSKDVEELGALPAEVIFVPGVFEDRYSDPSVPNRILRDFEDIPFLLTHTPTKDKHDLPGDINPTDAIKEGDARVLLHGHSHRWRIDEERGAFIINPGHLNPSDGRGQEMSYAILDVSKKKMDVKIYTLAGKILAEKTFFFDI